jgi:hypothetical protein
MQRLVRNYSALFILLYVAVGPVTADPIELTASGTIDFSIHSEELLGFPVAVGVRSVYVLQSRSMKTGFQTTRPLPSTRSDLPTRSASATRR